MTPPNWATEDVPYLNMDCNDEPLYAAEQEEAAKAKPKLTPTDEQENVKKLSKLHKALKISAYAGAAKTSTLCMVAEQLVAPSLMLTFNKALAEEAKHRFPSWVECRTTHSLAYQHFGVQLAKKLKRPTGPYKNVAGTGTEIAKYFKTGDFIYQIPGEYETRRMKAGGVGVAIKETVAKFEQSADRELSYKHVSTSPCDTMLLRDEASMRSYKYLVLGAAKKLWTLRTDLRSDVLATHDTYLKLYQLSNPDLSQYEILYLDECQDVNAVVLDIFLQQIDRCRLYAVGDGYQNIYSWRGAMNAMLELDWPEATLSKSFRFGQVIGDIANCVLAENGLIQTDVKGWEELTTEAMHKGDVDQIVYDQQHTMLFRTNGALIMEAVYQLDRGKRVNLEIDVSDFTKLLDSAIELKRGNMNKVKHESLVQFANWQEVQVEAEVVQGELIRVYNMVENGSVYKVLGVLSKHRNTQDYDVLLTTAHKSKGREFDVVILADDFPSPYNQQGEWVGLQDMERNLLYVALTRTKKLLGYNDTVQQMINRVKRYENTVSSEFDDYMGKEVRQLKRELAYQLGE